MASLESHCKTKIQHTRRECLEITGIPETTENWNLEDLTLKASETGNVYTVTHDIDLEVLFPGNNLIENVQRM